MNNILLISAIALLTSCKHVSSQSMINRANSSSQVKDKLQEYQAQPHRLAFNGDNFSYNEQPFQFGDSIKELVAIFGDYDYFNSRYYVWKDIGIVCSAKFREENTENKLTYISIYMNTKVDDKEFFKEKLNHKKDYFLLNGIPIKFDMPFNSFIDHSTYDLNEDFGANNRNYYLTENCDNGKKIKYIIDVTGGIYNYSGGGHLMISDGLNQNNDSLIESISFGYAKEEK